MVYQVGYFKLATINGLFYTKILNIMSKTASIVIQVMDVFDAESVNITGFKVDLVIAVNFFKRNISLYLTFLIIEISNFDYY